MTIKEQIAQRVAMEFDDGALVNLGAGIPLLCANYIPKGKKVYFQAENGIVGVCPLGEGEGAEPYRFDAGENICGILPGGATVDSATSFGLIRGGHLDATVLGAMQVDGEGSLANWMVPGGKFAGMGGAMDLVAGARKVIVATEHCDRNGNPKILEKCTFPLTGYRVVSLIVTELAIIEVTNEGLLLTELAAGVSQEYVQRRTGAKLKMSTSLRKAAI